MSKSRPITDIPPRHRRQALAAILATGVLRYRHGALLKRLLYCKACGRAMVHTFTGRGSKRYRYYTCTHAIKSGHDTCPSKSLPAGEIERVVVDQIRCIGQDADLLADVLQQARQHTEAEMPRLNVDCRDLER